VVHFSGHGNEKGEILLQNDQGHSERVSPSFLKELFREKKGRVRLVVLNACHTGPVAEAITEVIDCAVGVSEEVKDPAAIPETMPVMVMTTLPAFTFQILDAFRSMSKDLFEMTMSFRPRRWTLFRFLIVPTILPGILTAWKVNLGNAARVVVVAELVGATGGVGYQLLRQQQLFDMAGAMAWTLQLVLFVLVVQQTINAIETWALRYRAVSERTM